MSRTGFFKATVAMLAAGNAMATAARAAAQFGAAAKDKVNPNWHERIKGKNRRRRGYGGRSNSSSRFARKMQRHGAVYAPGKLFKGHRI